jgi:RecJ-like exonuclease
MGNKTLNSVPCPRCDGQVKNVVVDEDSIVNASRVPVLVSTKCENNHSVVLFVDRNFTIRDVEAAGEVVQEAAIEGAVDKAQKWMDNF